jgi:hypothetical protein
MPKFKERKKKKKLTLKQKLAKIDRKYNPRGRKVVSGGLPGLGKHR